MKKIYGFLIVAALLTGCYEDIGNYDYTDIKELTIAELRDDESSPSMVNVGDLITYSAKVTPSIDDNLSNYDIRWYIGDETRDDWNKLRFEWVADFKTKTYETIRIQITDKSTGITYFKEDKITINPEFVSGYGLLVLSDDNNDSVLGYVKYTEVESRPDPIGGSDNVIYAKNWKVYYDLYPRQNHGESMGTGPIGIQEHFMKKYGGQYCVFQQSGAIDLERDYLSKDIEFSAAFEDKTYPAGVQYLTGGNIMWWLDAVTDQQGRIYTRYKHDDNLYNTGVFGNDPIEFEGKVLSNCTVYRNPYSRGMYTLINDPDNGRILLMFEGGNGDKFGDHIHMNAGKIVEIPAVFNAAPEGYREFNDFEGCEILDVTIRTKGYNTIYISTTYRQKDTGEYFLQETNLVKTYYGTTLTHYAHKLFRLTIPEEVDKVYMPTSGAYHYLFIACGEKLYFIDLESGNTTAELYFTADSPITAIYTSHFRIYNIYLGTEGGYVYQLDTNNAKNKVSTKLDDESKILFRLGGFGKIVDIVNPRGVDHQNYI